MLLCPKQRLSYRIVEKKENKQTNNRPKVQDRTKLKKNKKMYRVEQTGFQRVGGMVSYRVR